MEFAGLDADAALVADLDGVGRLVVRVDLGAGQLGGAVLASGHVARAVRRVNSVVAHRDVALAENERVVASIDSLIFHNLIEKTDSNHPPLFAKSHR